MAIDQNMPIDVVIPCGEKDVGTLDTVIRHAQQHIHDIGTVYVVSPRQFTDSAAWVSDDAFPFRLDDIRGYIGDHPRGRWYLQQLIKLYVHRVIPGLSRQFLINDAETIWYQPVRFVDEDGRGLYCVSDEKSAFYYSHMCRLLPSLSGFPMGIHPKMSGIVHHMLFDQEILEDIFREAEEAHRMPFWRAFMAMVYPQQVYGGASEYEIYFCFAFAKYPDRVCLRHLDWGLSDHVPSESTKAFLTAHAHLRRG